jgi:hypothetical protein
LPTWKDEIAKGYLPYHQLTVDDFPIDDHVHPEGACWIQGYIRPYYHYQAKLSANGFVYAYITDWTVFSGFDKSQSSRKSTVRDMKPYLLSAQVTLDLNEIFARELAALKAGELPSGQGETFEKACAQLDDRVRAFVQTKVWQAEKETEAFSKATNQGQNQKKVRELSAKIRKRLEAMPPVAIPSSGTDVPAATPMAATPMPRAGATSPATAITASRALPSPK